MSAREPQAYASQAQARAAGLIPTSEAAALALLAVDTFRKLAGDDPALIPTRAGHSYWWDSEAVAAWAKARPRMRKPGEAPLLCEARACKRPVVAHGLCLMHYKRQRSGRKEPLRMVGDPIGAGQWGVLDETEDGVLCHECGRRFQSLGSHVNLAHGISAAEYKEMYGLPRGLPLTSTGLRERQSQRSREHNSARYLDAHRDPVKASHARDRDAFDAMARSQRMVARPGVSLARRLQEEHESIVSSYLQTKHGVTRQNHMYDLRLWTRWLEERDIHILAARRREIAQWINERLDAGISHRTINTNIGSMRSFYMWAIREEYIRDDPTLYIRKSRGPRPDRTFLSLADTRILLDKSLTFKGGMIAPQVHLWALSGLRPGEPRKLRIEDFSIHDGKPTILVDASKTPGRERLTLPSSTATLLEQAAGGRMRGLLLLNPHTGKPWVAQTERMIFYQLLEDAGLPLIHPYELRVGFITHALASGLDERLVMISARHSSTVHTAYYDRLREKVERSVGVNLARIIGAQEPTASPPRDSHEGRVHRFFSEDTARAAGYIPTDEALQLLGITRGTLLAHNNRRDNPAPAPVRVSHAYWWHRERLLAWDKTRARRTKPLIDNEGRTIARSTGGPCMARGCDRKSIAHGLCAMHYARLQSGRQIDEPYDIGAPIGMGQWGILEETDEGVKCHVCGVYLHSLSTHVTTIHHLTHAEYADAYGLPRGLPLASSKLRAQRRELSARIGGAHHLDGHINPQRASAARTKATMDAVARTNRQKRERLA